MWILMKRKIYLVCQDDKLITDYVHLLLIQKQFIYGILFLLLHSSPRGTQNFNFPPFFKVTTKMPKCKNLQVKKNLNQLTPKPAGGVHLLLVCLRFSSKLLKLFLGS